MELSVILIGNTYPRRSASERQTSPSVRIYSSNVPYLRPDNAHCWVLNESLHHICTTSDKENQLYHDVITNTTLCYYAVISVAKSIVL